MKKYERGGNSTRIGQEWKKKVRHLLDSCATACRTTSSSQNATSCCRSEVDTGPQCIKTKLMHRTRQGGPKARNQVSQKLGREKNVKDKQGDTEMPT